MLLRILSHRARTPSLRLAQMTAHYSNATIQDDDKGPFSGVSLQDLHKSNNFTSSLPPDPQYETPAASHKAPRDNLGPRMVKGALYTYVRPEKVDGPKLLATSNRAVRDIGLREGEEMTEGFKEMVAGNKIFWDETTGEGIYPWAQCYGGTSAPIALL